MTCFKYRQCHDNMPGSTYKSHLHNISPLSVSFSRFFSFFILGDRQCTHVVFCLCLGRSNAKRCHVKAFHGTKRQNCIPASHNGEWDKIQTQCNDVQDVKTKQVSCDLRQMIKIHPRSLSVQYVPTNTQT